MEAQKYLHLCHIIITLEQFQSTVNKSEEETVFSRYLSSRNNISFRIYDQHPNIQNSSSYILSNCMEKLLLG